ncbi:MAG: SIMPL domain-containing protein [Microthrixaceae bacterium]
MLQNRSTTAARRFLTASAVAAALLASTACGQRAPVVNVSSSGAAGSATGSNGIVVSGTGKVSGTPDTVTLTMGVSVKRASAPDAIAAGAQSARKVIDALEAAGVSEKDIQTTNYSIGQEFTYPSGRPPVPDGFRVSNDVAAKVRAVDEVGAVIDAATAAGGSDVRMQGLSFSLDDDTAALAGARDKAFAEAKAKAEQFARLSGRRLGSVQSIVQSDVAPPTSVALGASRETADQVAATPIQPGEVSTSVTVEVRWAFSD